jgi:hypothetical protein
MNDSQSHSILKRVFLSLALIVSFHLSSYANTVVLPEDESQPVIIQSTNDYNWYKLLEGNVFWVSNLDHYKMEQYQFHDDYVLITEVDFRDGWYQEELNTTYNVTDGVLEIDHNGNRLFYNITSSIEGEQFSNKVKSTKEATKFIDLEDLEFEIALQNGSIGKLIINDGIHNGELPDLFKIIDSKGSMIDSFDDLNSTISFIDSLDNNQSYPFPKWIELKNKPTIESLKNHQVTNFQTRHFFFEEQKMREYHLTSAFMKITDGPISYSIPAHWDHTTHSDFYKWGDSSSYNITNHKGESFNLTFKYTNFPEDLEEWTKMEKNEFQNRSPNSTFQNDDGTFKTDSNNFKGSAIIHGYHDEHSSEQYNFSIGIEIDLDLEHIIEPYWLIGSLTGNMHSIESQSYETALYVARTIDFNYSWSSPEPIDTNISLEPPVAVTYPDPNAYIPDSKKINRYWYHSDWFNYYYQAEMGWIFQPDIGWMHSTPNHQTRSVWLYSQELGWVWTSRDVFPFLFSNVRSNWIYFMEPNNLFPSYPHFYDYQNQDWKDTSELFTDNEVDNQNSINYQEKVIHALDQFIRGK